jgi:hypothetical protein
MDERPDETSLTARQSCLLRNAMIANRSAAGKLVVTRCLAQVRDINADSPKELAGVGAPGISHNRFAAYPVGPPPTGLDGAV